MSTCLSLSLHLVTLLNVWPVRGAQSWNSPQEPANHVVFRSPPSTPRGEKSLQPEQAQDSSVSVPDAAPCSRTLRSWFLPFEPIPPRLLPSLGTADAHLSRPSCVEQDGLCCSYDAPVSNVPSRNAWLSPTGTSSARHQAGPLHSGASVPLTLSWSQVHLCVYK